MKEQEAQRKGNAARRGLEQASARQLTLSLGTKLAIGRKRQCHIGVSDHFQSVRCEWFGYATSWFGKHDNTPEFQASQVGPFDQWPTGMGFEYFYGFVGGDTSQWQPHLFRNTAAIYPYVGQWGWNLTTAMAVEAIGWLKQLNAIAPDKPFFVFYAPGGTHAPHHPMPEWIKYISDMHLFDEAPSVLDKSYTITAEVEIPVGGAEGMLVTEGG